MIKLLLFLSFYLFNLQVNAQNNQSKVKQLLNYNKQDYQENIKQIDLAIQLAKKENNQNLLSEAYFTKAAYIFNFRKYHESLNYYIKANQLAKNSDAYFYYSSLYGIATIKQQLGEYKQSTMFLEKCLAYFDENKQHKECKIAYVNTLGRLAYAYIKIGNYNKAKFYSDAEFKNSNNAIDSAYAFKNLGILKYHLNQHSDAIKILDKAMLTIKKNNDKAWLMTILHYKGDAYLGKGDLKNANDFYRQVVEEFKQSKIVNNDSRTSFERLIKYYHQHNDKENELNLINQLLAYDSVYYATNQTLSNSYFKDYENSNLIEQQAKLSQDIKYSKLVIYLVISISVLIIAGILIKNKRDKNRLATYINSVKEKDTTTDFDLTLPLKKIEIEVDDETEQKLKNFEANLTSIDANLTVDQFAEMLNCNKSYISRYINQTRELNFNQYINSLRIQLIVNRLMEDENLRKYTIDALAEEAGFNSRKLFSDVFLKHTGFRPSYFIKNLKNQ